VVTQSPTVRRLGAVVAVILGVLVVVALMSTRFAHGPTVPAATPGATLNQDYGPPPAGVPLLYVKDPNQPAWLIGFDWTGQPRGTLKLDPAIGSVGMAPDGQSFAVGFGSKGGTGEILDRLGQPVTGVGGAIPGSALPMWADDAQHTCGIAFDPQTLTSTLVTLAPGQAVKSAVVLGQDQQLPNSFRIASCSFRNDEAIVVRSANPWPSELLAVKLSNGKVTSLTTYATPALLADVVASKDSTLIAENSSQSVQPQNAPMAPSTIIRRVADQSAVMKLAPTMGVLAFNSDDSLVLVNTSPWAGGTPTAMSIIDLKSGQQLWNYTGPGMFGNALGEPSGRDFAIYVRKPGIEDPLVELTIVHTDGTISAFPRRYEPAW
jgi:hypothetical protein